VAVERGEGRGEHSVEPCDRTELRCLVERDEAARHAAFVLQCDALLERRDVVGVVEKEEVPDLLEVDLCAGPLAEAHEGLDAAQPDRDVHRIRELGAEASGRPARRAPGELSALEEAHADSCLREWNAMLVPTTPPPTTTTSATGGSEFTAGRGS
jgi:hypothetical protein